MQVRHLLLIGATVALFVLPGCDGLFDPDDDHIAEHLVKAWLPLAEAAKWRYVEVETGPQAAGTYVYTLEVFGTAQRGGRTYFELAVHPSDTPDLFRVEGDVAYEWPRDMPFEIPVYDMSLAPGQSRDLEEEYVIAGDTMRMVGRLTYVRDETVTTPAGTFNDARVFERSGSLSMSSQPELVLEGGNTRWFARGAGIVKEIHSFTDGTTEETSSVTLHYYAIPGGLTGGHDGNFQVSGRVVQFTGPPVQEVALFLCEGSSDDDRYFAVSGGDGTFVIPDVQAGIYTLRLFHMPEDFWHDPASFDIEIEVIEQDVVLPDIVVVHNNDPDGFLISGETLNPDGFPVQGATILMSHRPLDWAAWEVDVDGRGEWSVGPVPPGTYVLRAEAEHFSFQPDSVVVTLGQASIGDLLFEGTGGATLNGRLLTPIGHGMEAVEIEISDPLQPDRTRTTVTDAAGAYAFFNVPALGSGVRIRANAPGYEVDPGDYVLQITGTEIAVPDMIIQPDPQAWHHTVSGSITNSRGLPPIGDFIRFVLYSPLFGIERDSHVEWGSTEYTIAGAFDGHFVLRAEPSRYSVSPDSVLVTVAGQSLTGLDFSFTGFSIHGRVVDQSGTPVAGATVTLASDLLHDLVITTGADGRFGFADLILTGYDVIIEKDDLYFEPSRVDLDGDHDLGDIAGEPIG